jgi:hypothetical protein
MAEGSKTTAGTTSDLILYSSPAGTIKVGVLVRDESVWLTQRALSELFEVGVPAIAKHLKNIFDSGELRSEAVISILETTAADGKTYQRQGYDPAFATVHSSCTGPSPGTLQGHSPIRLWLEADRPQGLLSQPAAASRIP